MAIATSRPNSAPRPSARFLGLALLAACSGSGDRGVPLDAGVAPSDGPSASDDGGRALDAGVSAPDTPPDSGDGGRALDGADGPVSVDGADAGGGDAGQVETSPGTTIVRLKLAPGSSFCDSHTICDPVRHIFVRDSSGRPLTVALPGCALVCSQACLPPVCPGAACFPQGFPLSSEELVWTGRYYERSACGAGLGCYREHYAPAGSYVAVVCATPGVSTRPDGGGNYTCTNTAARQCVEIPFAFPSASPVEVTLGP